MPTLHHRALPPNVGLADLSGVAKVFYHLRRRFFPVEFADLCTLIDEIVLREHIILVGKADTTPGHYLAAIQPLRDAGVFRLLAEPVALPRLSAPPLEIVTAAEAASRSGLTSATVIDADLEITRLLGAEAKLGLPATVLLRNLHNFGLGRRPKFEHTAFDLVHRSRKLASDARLLHAEIQRNGPPRRGFTFVDAPPLALTLFKSAGSFEQVMERLLDMRAAHRRLRADTTALHEQLTDPRTSIADHNDLVRDWESKWRKSWENALANRMYICNTSAGLVAKGVDLITSLGAGAWRDAFSASLALIDDLSVATSLHALRPLHSPVRDYLMGTRTQMAAAVSRVWETDPHRIDELMAEIAAPNSLWRKAFRNERP
ncbi:MAG: hypothetical protein ABI885_30535 [Gammaproteobacteria bacterium]